LLGEDLLHSVNGREYVTAAHLKIEVTDAVNGAGGRIAVVRCRGHACSYILEAEAANSSDNLKSKMHGVCSDSMTCCCAGEFACSACSGPATL